MRLVERRFLLPVLASAAVIVGCVAEDPDLRPGAVYRGIFPCGESVAKAPADEEPVARHQGPWEWEALAVRAGELSDASRVAYIDAAAKRLKAESDLTWRDPEIRFGGDWDWTRGDGREHRSDGSVGPDWNRSNGGGGGGSAGVRFYVPNPFVDRYARARARAGVRKSEANAAVEAYGVYSEVKMLCFEAVRTKREMHHLERYAAVAEDLKKICEQSHANGVFGSPLDIIRSETRLEKVRAKLNLMARERTTLLHRIAWLAGVEADELELADNLPVLPPPESLSVAELTELAFVRRPDLTAALAEVDAAEAGVSMSKAANIPWFRFVEATYSYGREWKDKYEFDRRSDNVDHDEEFALKASVYLPVFTWMGQSVTLSKTVRERANARLNALYASIRHEVAMAYAGYADATARVHDGEMRSFVARMERRIGEYARSKAAKAEDVCKAREELMEYESLAETLALSRTEAALRLESIIGGPFVRVVGQSKSNYR